MQLQLAGENFPRCRHCNVATQPLVVPVVIVGLVVETIVAVLLTVMVCGDDE